MQVFVLFYKEAKTITFLFQVETNHKKSIPYVGQQNIFIGSEANQQLQHVSH